MVSWPSSLRANFFPHWSQRIAPSESIIYLPLCLGFDFPAACMAIAIACF